MNAGAESTPSLVLKQGARRGARTLRVCAREPRALQGAAQCDLRQRATQTATRKVSKRSEPETSFVRPLQRILVQNIF